MIRREVMERYFPEFVAKLDKELAEATAFCRSEAKNIVWPRKKKAPYRTTITNKGVLPAKIVAIMETVDEITLTELNEQIDDKYNRIKGAVATLIDNDVVIRLDRGLYKLKEAPRQERT